MAGWQITAKTLFCDAVDDEVTVMVYQNGTTRCTGCQKYTEPNDITRQAVREKTRRLKHPIKCQGEQCSNVTSYKEQILTEENG